MKANELRIGNLIKWISTGEIEVVKDIETVKRKTGNVNNVSISDCVGIELTEECLIKFGFSSNRRLREKQFKSKAVDGDVRLTLWTGTNGNGFYYSDVIQIKYVHQLQNLYFAVSGEELELKQ